MSKPNLAGSASRGPSEPVRTAGRQAFGLLVEQIVVCQGSGSVPLGDPHEIALAAWATVHGLATIVSDELLDDDELGDTTQLASAVTTRMIDGLRSRPLN